MNPAALTDAKRIARRTRTVADRLSHTDVVVCPPFAFILAAISRSAAKNFSIGAQSVSFESEGAHTGEVSAVMLRDLGVSRVIVGHSEQRAQGDTDATVARRAIAVLDAGLSPIVCVGEKVRDDSGGYLDILKDQIKGSLVGVPAGRAKDIVIAYEPIWAIGGKEAMAPADIHETVIFVRKVFSDLFGPELAMKMKVLYGGAVNFRNAADIISIGNVDGLLVGRESVNMPGFSELLKAVDAIKS